VSFPENERAGRGEIPFSPPPPLVSSLSFLHPGILDATWSHLPCPFLPPLDILGSLEPPLGYPLFMTSVAD